MSTDVHTELIRAGRPVAVAPRGTGSEDPRTRFAAPTAWRLTSVELRKAVDTRAGRWLLIASVLLAAAVAIARGVTGAAADRTFADCLELALLPFGILLPVLGILLMTGEWSQRTALATYALVPDRARITWAKVRAGLLIGLGAAVASVAAAAIGNAIGIAVGGADGSWSTSLGDLGQTLAAQELNLLMGVGFGLLLTSPALAIVAFFALPTAFTILGETVSSLRSVFDWIDPNRAFDPLLNVDVHAGDWPKILVCALLWVGVPLVAGIARTHRREIK